MTDMAGCSRCAEYRRALAEQKNVGIVRSLLRDLAAEHKQGHQRELEEIKPQGDGRG